MELREIIKNEYKVFTNKKIMLLFRKKHFINVDDYDKSINFIKEKIKEK